MAALKSDNPINAKINQNFVIRVLVNPKENPAKNTKLTTAKQLSKFLQDEEHKIRLFKKVLEGGADRYTFLIRNRLKIDFHSK